MIRRKQRNVKKLLKIILLWLPFIIYISLFPPSSVFSFLGFYTLLSGGLFYTFKSYLSFNRAIFWTGIIIIYLVLRQFRLDNILNTIILAAIFITLEIYFRKN